jgi:hypothetical protein
MTTPYDALHQWLRVTVCLDSFVPHALVPLHTFLLFVCSCRVLTRCDFMSKSSSSSRSRRRRRTRQQLLHFKRFAVVVTALGLSSADGSRLCARGTKDCTGSAAAVVVVVDSSSPSSLLW